MNIQTIALSALLTLAMASTAMAQAQPGLSEPSAGGLQADRAEVQADFQLWRQAGLEEFSLLALRDAQPARYQQALSRYKALRASPAFTELVQRLRGPMAVAAR